jgi:hypothetical protein
VVPVAALEVGFAAPGVAVVWQGVFLSLDKVFENAKHS